MNPSAAKHLSSIEKFEHRGVNYHNMIGWLQKPGVLTEVYQWVEEALDRYYPEAGYLVMPESRGYVVAGVAAKRRMGVVLCPKDKKLPDSRVDKVKYGTEYSEDCLTMLKGSITPGGKCVIFDDALATGGSYRALKELVEMQGGVVVGALFLLDLGTVEHHFQYHAYMYDRPAKLIKYTPAANAITLTNNQVVVLSSPALEYMARNIDGVYLPIQWDRFPDGTHNIKFPACLKGRKVRYFMSMQPDLIWQEILVMQVLARQGLQRLDIYIPYLPSGTMERVTAPGVLATAEVELRMISEQPITKQGPARIHFLDAHAPIELFYLRDNVHVIHHSATRLLKPLISQNKNVIVFPDNGGYNRFKSEFDDPTAVCSKLRDPTDPLARKVTITETYNIPPGFDWKSAEFLIVDDLVHSGGTLLECAKMLKASFGDVKVSAYVTHMVGENNSFEKLLNGPFEKVYFTDSTPTSMRAYAFKPEKCHLIRAVEAMGRVHFNSRSRENVILASTSQVKALGVYQSLLGGGDFDLYTLDLNGPVPVTASEYVKRMRPVPPQPITDEETVAGAKNRMVLAGAICQGFPWTAPVYIYSVESGLAPFTKGSPDAGEVTVAGVCQLSDVREYLEDYMKVETHLTCDIGRNFHLLPRNIVDDYCSKMRIRIQDRVGGVEKTLGSHLAETLGCSADNWHTRILGVSRSQIITDLFNGFSHDEPAHNGY